MRAHERRRGRDAERNRGKEWVRECRNSSLRLLQKRDGREGGRMRGATKGERGWWLGGEEWGIVMSSSTVTNDRTEFANCDRTQLLPKGCLTHPGGNVSSVAGQFRPTQGRISMPFNLIANFFFFFFQNNNISRKKFGRNSFYLNIVCKKILSHLYICIRMHLFSFPIKMCVS